MMLTQLFTRFLKQENLYVQFSNSHSLVDRCFYNGVLDNIILDDNSSARGDGGKITSIFYFLSANDARKWRKFWKINKFDIVEVENYTNLATKLLKEFARNNNIEKEISEVLYTNGQITKLEIKY